MRIRYSEAIESTEHTAFSWTIAFPFGIPFFEILADGSREHCIDSRHWNWRQPNCSLPSNIVMLAGWPNVN